MSVFNLSKGMKGVSIMVAACVLLGALSGCGSKAPSDSDNTWSENSSSVQNTYDPAPELTPASTPESPPVQFDDNSVLDVPANVSQFTWEIGSGKHIAIGQSKEQIDNILGEVPERPSTFDDKSSGMYREKYKYTAGRGFEIAYNRAGEAVLFFAENADITDFLGIRMGDTSSSVFNILAEAYGEEKIIENSGGFTYTVYFDSDGNAVEWTSQFEHSYVLSLHCNDTLDIMQIYWQAGAYKQVSDCKSEIVGTMWELGYVLDPFGEPQDAVNFFGSGLREGTSLIFNEDNTFEYWIGLNNGYGTYTTDGDRILLTYEGGQSEYIEAGDTGLMIYYFQYTNPNTGVVSRAISLDFMSWDAASSNNKPYDAFFVEVG